MRRRGASLLIFGLCASILAFVGCRAPASFGPGLPSEGTRLAVDDARAESVLRSYLDLAGARSALRGSARVLLEGPDFKLNRPQRILVERPARLRFEVLGLFDQLAAMLATNGRLFGFYDVSTGDISRGRVTPTLLWDLAKIDLDVDEVVGLLLAAPLPSPGIARTAVWLEPDGRLALVFAWPDEDAAPDCEAPAPQALFDAACFVELDSLEAGGEVFLFDVSGRLVEVRNLSPGGAIRYRATFEDYAVQAIGVGGSEIEFPNRITLRSPEAESMARFTWKRVMFAEGLSDRFFMIPDRRAAFGDG